jgi:hypothetical protein
MSHLYSHMLTSCFLDTILLPLCTWIYFLSLILFLVLSSRDKRTAASHPPRRRNPFRSHKKSDYSNPTAAGQKYSLSKTRRFAELIYGFLLAATLGMAIIEHVRLVLAHLGVGLLPFALIALVGAGYIHYSDGIGGRVRAVAWLNAELFFSLAVVNGVKLAGELKEGFGTRKGTKYPMSDQVTDVGVMIGLEIILGALEIVLR